MTHLLNCPVCGYKEIEGNTCPNCDVDLSLIRSLTELPALEKAEGDEGAEGVKSISKVAGWQVGVALLILIFGIGLGTLGSFIFLQPQLISNKITSPPVAIKGESKIPSAIAQEPVKRPQQPSQTYYKVKPGDSLSKIAEVSMGMVLCGLL
jgi:hypothetical protein